MMSDGYTLGSGIIMMDGVSSMGVRDSTTYAAQAAWGSNMIDPTSVQFDDNQVILQGESAMPTSVGRITSSSPLYPHR